MKMVGHNHKFVQGCSRKMGRDIPPASLDDAPNSVYPQLARCDFSK